MRSSPHPVASSLSPQPVNWGPTTKNVALKRNKEAIQSPVSVKTVVPFVGTMTGGPDKRRDSSEGWLRDDDEEDEDERDGDDRTQASKSIEAMLGSTSPVRMSKTAKKENEQQKYLMRQLPAISTSVLPGMRSVEGHVEISSEDMERFDSTLSAMRTMIETMKRGHRSGGVSQGLSSTAHQRADQSQQPRYKGQLNSRERRPMTSPGSSTSRKADIKNNARPDAQTLLDRKLRKCRKHLAEFLAHVEVNKRQRLQHIREQARPRPEWRYLIKAVPNMTLEETVEVLRQILGSTGGNRLAAKLWDSEAVMELHRIVQEEDRRKGLIARQQLGERERVRREDLVLKLYIKDRKYFRRAEREAEEAPIKAWLVLISVIQHIQGFQNKYHQEREAMHTRALQVKAALVIHRTFRRFRARRGEIMLQRIFVHLHYMMILRCRRFLLGRRRNAVKILTSFLLELQKNKSTFGTLACLSKRTMAAVQHFRRATIHVQSLWRMQLIRSQHYRFLLTRHWEGIIKDMVEDKVQRIIDHEVATFAPENIKITEMNKLRRVQNKPLIPLKKPPERSALLSRINELMFIPPEIRDGLVRGFVREAMSHQGQLNCEFLRKHRAFVKDIKSKVQKLSQKYARFATYSSLQVLSRSPKPPQPLVLITDENCHILIGAAYKYMEDLKALWDPHRPSRDANGQLMHSLFPTPQTVGRKLAKWAYRSDSAGAEGDEPGLPMPPEELGQTLIERTRLSLTQSFRFNLERTTRLKPLVMMSGTGDSPGLTPAGVLSSRPDIMSGRQEPGQTDRPTDY